MTTRPNPSPQLTAPADQSVLPAIELDPNELPPPRPRRRLFGPGANLLQIALLGVLLAACGFIGGVLVEKGQASSSTTGAGLASQIAALRGTGTAADSASGRAGASGARGIGGVFGGGARGGLGGGMTIGEVSYISGNTLYVSDLEGNTVKVKTSAASSITRTVKTGVHEIHPGETVVVRGMQGSGGTISAESVSVGAGGGAFGGLFGGGRRGLGLGGSQGTAANNTPGGETEGTAALFGK